MNADTTEAAVCIDIIKRQNIGIKKYGTTVALNPLSLKQWMQHAYEECLDQAIYLRRAIDQLDREEAKKSFVRACAEDPNTEEFKKAIEHLKHRK